MSLEEFFSERSLWRSGLPRRRSMAMLCVGFVVLCIGLFGVGIRSGHADWGLLDELFGLFSAGDGRGGVHGSVVQPLPHHLTSGRRASQVRRDNRHHRPTVSHPVVHQIVHRSIEARSAHSRQPVPASRRPASIAPPSVAAIAPKQTAAPARWRLASIAPPSVAAIAPKQTAAPARWRLASIAPPSVAAIAPKQTAAPARWRLASIAPPSEAVIVSKRTAAPAKFSRRTVCVRACDGYFFPIGNLNGLSNIADHQAACDRLCPGAEAKLFLMPEGSYQIEDAVAARGGGLYTQILARLDTSNPKAGSCSCQSAADNRSVELNAYFRDFTLRPGDTVATPEGMRIVRRGGHFPFKPVDFQSLVDARDMTQARRGALAAMEIAMKCLPPIKTRNEPALSEASAPVDEPYDRLPPFLVKIRLSLSSPEAP